MEQFPKVFVIILNYNGEDTLKKCLDSVFKSTYPNLSIIIIDNNSQDNSFKMAQTLFDRAYFIKNNHNIGFAAGNNVGIRYALEKMADYVFLLNNDAYLEKSALSKLINFLEKNKKIGIASPLILKEDTKKIWFSKGKIDWLKMKTQHLINDVWHIDPATKYKIGDTDYLTGCALLVRNDVFKKIGLLDEDFFLYYEDADFSLRAKRAGFEQAVLKDAVAYHYEKSQTKNSKKIYWLVFSGVLFFKKNSVGAWKFWINFYLFLRKIKNKMDLLFKKSELISQIAKAYKDADEKLYTK